MDTWIKVQLNVVNGTASSGPQKSELADGRAGAQPCASLFWEFSVTKAIGVLDPNGMLSFLLFSHRRHATYKHAALAPSRRRVRGTWHISSHTSFRSSLCFSFSFVAEGERERWMVSHGEAGTLLSVIPTSLKGRPSTEQVCFVQTGRDESSLCLNKQVPGCGAGGTRFAWRNWNPHQTEEQKPW